MSSDVDRMILLGDLMLTPLSVGRFWNIITFFLPKHLGLSWEDQLIFALDEMMDPLKDIVLVARTR